jgi:hypothetical protein
MVRTICGDRYWPKALRSWRRAISSTMPRSDRHVSTAGKYHAAVSMAFDRYIWLVNIQNPAKAVPPAGT